MSIPKLDHLIEVKDEILSEYRRHLARGTALTPDLLEPTEGESSEQPDIDEGWAPIAIPRPEQRLSVGVAKDSRGEYRLDVRIRRGDGVASRAAERIQQKLSSSQVQIVEDVAAPKRTARGGGRQSTRLRRIERPLHIGLSVGRSNSGAGTLGVFVRPGSTNGWQSGVGFLSSVAVLAPGERPTLGDPVYQPGRPDVDRLEPKLAIGQVRDFVELSPTYPNRVAAAMAELSSELASVVQENRIPAGVGFDRERAVISHVDDDVFSWAGERVGKIGRTTGYTRGVVSAVAMDGITVLSGRQNVMFDDVLEIRSDPSEGPFSGPGDSGSLVFLEDRNLAAIGLIFAAGTVEGESVSYAFRLDLALEYLDLELLGT